MSARYKIDSVSNLYPALGGLVYRLCAVLAEPVQKGILHRVRIWNAPFSAIAMYLQRITTSFRTASRFFSGPICLIPKSRLSALPCVTTALSWMYSTATGTAAQGLNS